MLALSFPMIDPVLVQIGPFAIRWYALAYVAGILLGWFYIRYLNRKQSFLSSTALDDCINWSIIGIILGGRLGYVLFYNPSYYVSNPLEILKIWNGGMSFHGGMIGLVLAIFLLCRKHQTPFLPVMDMFAAAAPMGLMFGRIANFINGELYGRVTDSPFGVIFPDGGPEPRHPSQLYEAALEGALLFTLLFVLAHYSRARERRGLLCGIFLVGYALGRTLVEHFFREPDIQLGYIAGLFTMGQILSLPMLLLGLFLIIRSYRSSASTPSLS